MTELPPFFSPPEPKPATTHSKATGFLSGRVSHCRFQPRLHKFNYRYGCFWLALDRLDQAQREQPHWFTEGFGWIKFRRKDHIGPQEQNLADTIRQLANLDNSPDNQVFFLGQLSYLGRYFSPVNFFFIGTQHVDTESVDNPFAFHTLIAEVSNTPWNEKHHYVVPLNNTRKPHRHQKTFHVSPFMPIEQEYHWQVDYGRNEFAITIHSTENKRRKFTAALTLKAEPMNQSNLLSVFISNGFMIAGIKLKIYWQALKLFFKKIPYQRYPGMTGNQNTDSVRINTHQQFSED
jgi:DUF1365 family protein